MSCPVDIDLSSPEYFHGVLERSRQQRVPLCGYFDLTHRCNLRCAHCYLGHMVAQPRSEAAELTTEQFKRILMSAAESGCLFAVFSGGEPLLRDDFIDVYKTARGLGMIITVFTNATLVKQRHVSLFQEYGVHRVDVSVYGASEETYTKVTKVSGSFGRMRAGVESLLDGGISVSFKSMILRDNCDDILAIERMAMDYGVEYLVDPLVWPRLDGDRTPTSQRVEPGKAVGIELGLEGRRADFRKVRDREQRGLGVGTHQTSQRLYQCGAGLVGFHVDPKGWMRPCLFSRQIEYNAAELGFADAWRSTVSAVDGALASGSDGCRVCSDRALCGYCVAISALEGASTTWPSSYMCELGKRRRTAVREVSQEVECAATR